MQLGSGTRPFFRTLFFAVLFLTPTWLPAQSAPSYTADTIINTAAGVAGSYASYTFLTINGQNLATVTRAIATSDLLGNQLPTTVPGTGVRVLINAVPAFMFSVSPQHVLLLMPRLAPGAATLQLEANGVAGPPVQLLLNTTAPGLFTQADGVTVNASHLDWTLLSTSSPAHAEEWVSLWAAGLGTTNPQILAGQLPSGATEIADRANFKVLLDGIPLDPSRIEYAGVAPGFAGLYQINIKLPPGVPSNPEIRISTADQISPAQRFLNVE